MPDAHGKLTPEDHAKLHQWWKSRWTKTVICPVCDTSEWTVGQYVVNVPRAAADAMEPSQPTYQMIVVGCKNCSHTRFFNAVQIGLMPTYTPSEEAVLLPAPIVEGQKSG